MEENNDKKPLRKLEELGEFGLIDYLTRDLVILNDTTVKGVGDDAAVLKTPRGHFQLASSDMMVENVHFDLTYFPLKHLGYKLAVINFSDIYAMNGYARQLLVDIAVSNRFTLEALEEFYTGLKIAAQRYGVDIVGGDTVSSQKGMILAGTALGHVKKDRVVYRSGARAHDLLVVTGDLGAAYAGLLVLLREKETFLANPRHQPDLTPYAYVVERQLKPEARKDVIEWLEQNDVIPTCMIDISDGLSSEVIHLTEASGKGAVIYEEKIPIARETAAVMEEFRIHPLTAALNGGEDYELLFGISQKDYEKIKDVPGFHIIGHFTEDPGAYLVTKANQQIELKAQGWNAFLERRRNPEKSEGNNDTNSKDEHKD
ncbi:MAG: thiamine-phosphate kinase [Chlorobi bacterium]|nr:thiamine-phosphate kinase [Chlorobiota bacterium]